MRRLAVLIAVLALTTSPVRVDLTPPFDGTLQVAVLSASCAPTDAPFDHDGSTRSEQRLEPRPRTGTGPVQADEDGAFSGEETELILRFGGGLACDCNEFPSSRDQGEDPTRRRGLNAISRGPPSHLREQPDRPAGAPIAILSSLPSSS